MSMIVTQKGIEADRKTWLFECLRCGHATKERDQPSVRGAREGSK
jgi:Zn ribbon nucleic-acid-binding protein